METAHNNNKNIEKIIKNLDLDLTVNKAAHDAVCQDVLVTHEQSMKKETTARRRNIYSTIIKIPIIKLTTAAAVLIIAVLSGINYWPSIKTCFKFGHTPVEHLYLRSSKDSIHTFTDEGRADSNKKGAEKEKEKEQSR